MAGAHTRSPFVMRRQRSALQEGFAACAVWSFQSGRIPRAFLHFCAPPSRLRPPSPSWRPPPVRSVAVAPRCSVPILLSASERAARWPRAHRGPASLDLLLMKKPHGMNRPSVRNSRFIPFPSPLPCFRSVLGLVLPQSALRPGPGRRRPHVDAGPARHRAGPLQGEQVVLAAGVGRPTN